MHEAAATHGKNWESVARAFPGRSARSVETKYNKELKRRVWARLEVEGVVEEFAREAEESYAADDADGSSSTSSL